MLLLPHSWVLLPPKSLRSRFGDSERFKPLQREGDRFTADGGGEARGQKARTGGQGGKRGGWKDRDEGREREREVFTEGRRDFWATLTPGARPRPAPFTAETQGSALLRPLQLPIPCTWEELGRGGPQPLSVQVFGLMSEMRTML